MREKVYPLLFHLFVFVLFGMQANTHAQTADSINPDLDSTIIISGQGNFIQLNWDQIRLLPFRNIKTFGLISSSAYRTKGDNMYYYGFRSDENQYFIDGMQIRNIENFPVRLIQSYDLFTGEAPIELGFTSAAISRIKTQNKFDEFTVLADLNTDLSKSMQGFNGEILLGIPLAGRKKKNTIKPTPYLLISGKYHWTNNYDPIWKETQKLKAGVLDELYKNPLRQTEHLTGTNQNAEFVLGDDFTNQKVPDHHGKTGIYPFVKLDLPFTKNSRLTIGSYSQFEEKEVYDFDNSVFNAANNSIQTKRNFDSYIRWNQNIDISEKLSIDYDLGFQYSNHYLKNESKQHGDQFFDYGYIGNFTTHKTPTFELGSDSVNGEIYEDVWLLNSWDYDTLVDFSPSNVNSGLSNYTKNYYSIFEDRPEGHYQNIDQIQMGGGLINGDEPRSVYGLYNNTATNSSIYRENHDERIRATFNVKINYKSHVISVGGEYNAESNRQYAISPNTLWQMMRGLTNFHLRELDTDNPIAIDNNGTVDTIIYKRLYDSKRQMAFDINLRKALGLAVDGLDFILTDSYDPKNNTISYYDQYGTLKTISTPTELLDLNLFTPEELLNYGYSLISYAGYDFNGEKQKENYGPYSFYENYKIDAVKQSYWAAYIQDDYNWKNLHVKLGVRIDVYDSKRPVLNDIYSLFPIYNVKEAKSDGNLDFKQPSNIGDDFAVYTDRDYAPHFVTGFRDNDTWYDANGKEINDPNILDVGSGVSPFLKYPEIYEVGEEGWSPEMTFRDNKRSVNFLPQIKIDYTFNKGLNIYVSYSSFTQNPTYVNDFRPELYSYWQNVIELQVIPNPLIKPMRTGKLFAGIKRFIWKNLLADVSYLFTTIDNYYTVKFIMGGYPDDYFTYANSDQRISTNGFQIKFDFVNPTSSGAFGGISFVKLFPQEDDLNFRHVSDAVLNTYIGYRFGNRHNYTGPAWGNNKALRGLGASIYYQFRRGLPYYRPTKEPGIKGNPNHMPGTNLFNLNIQKDFLIGNKAMLNVYLTIENLFNFKNVFDVYNETGQADDDGFLSDPANQGIIDHQTNPDSFSYLYQLHLYNPEHFDIPRIWRVGVIFKY